MLSHFLISDWSSICCWSRDGSVPNGTLQQSTKHFSKKLLNYFEKYFFNYFGSSSWYYRLFISISINWYNRSNYQYLSIFSINKYQWLSSLKINCILIKIISWLGYLELFYRCGSRVYHFKNYKNYENLEKLEKSWSDRRMWF